MKIAVKRLIKDEKGQMMILALILLLVGGLVITPLLAYMSTGLIASEVYDRRTTELYAADAGMEGALWQLEQSDPDIPTTPEEPPLTYTLNSTVNNKTVEVTIDMVSGATGGGIYKVTSTATSTSGSNTTIESYIATSPLFWNHAITSTSDVILESNSEIYGDVMGDVSGPGTVYGEIGDPYDPDKWPFDQDFRDYYFQPPTSNTTLPYDICGGKDKLDVNNYTSLGPGYHDHDGGNLIIYSTGDNITATLTGNVYIKGDEATLEIGGGGQPFYLDLNFHTIYVEGCSYNLSTPNKNALYIPPGKVTIMGSGAIIAEGNIDFQPNMETGSEDDFVFVLSVYGRMNFQPNGTLYGAVAAQEVEVGPGNVLHHTNSPTDPDTGEQVMDFPLDVVATSANIFTWDISH